MMLNGRKLVLYAFVMEIVDMALILLIASPFDKAMGPVNVIAMPMILGDTGVAIFAFMLKDTIKRKSAAR